MKEIAITIIICGAVLFSVGICAEAYTRARRHTSDNWLQAQREQIAAGTKTNRQITEMLRSMGAITPEDSE